MSKFSDIYYTPRRFVCNINQTISYSLNNYTIMEKYYIKVISKNADYVDFFFFDLLIKLIKNIYINEYTIKLVRDK